MGDFGKWKVEDYNLTSADGRHIRKATRVIGYGYVVNFMEKMPREKAILQTREIIARGLHDSGRHTTKRFVD